MIFGMSSKDLAAACGVSQRQIYNLKTKFPKEVPASFDDVDGWKKVVAAHQVVVAQKRHAPRSTPGEQSDNARYIAARARKTEIQAESEHLRLEVTRRGLIPRVEVEAAFSTVANLVKARLRRLVNDAPSVLLGLNEHEIHQTLGEQIELALNEIAMEKDFYKPRGI
jgi:hypothetical protein